MSKRETSFSIVNTMPGTSPKQKKIKRSTVKFNVGGKLFEISRSLLDSFPDTMIYKAASKTWIQEKDEPIFIERNCDRFQFVLDYMRDGHCSLPYDTTKDAVLNELSYFGFDNVDPEKIIDEYSPSIATNIVASYYKKHQVLIQNLDLEKQYTNFAFICLNHYIKTSKVEMIVSKDDYENCGSFYSHHDYSEWHDSTGPSNAYQQNILLKKCAAEFGLEYITVVENWDSGARIKFGFSKISKH